MEVKGYSCLIVYRGPLERSRVAFLLSAFSGLHRNICFVWIFPGLATPRTHENFKRFRADFSNVDWHWLNHRWHQFFQIVPALKRIIKVSRVPHLVLIGRSAAPFSNLVIADRITWCINGIPEEKQLSGGWFTGYRRWPSGGYTN